MKFSVFLVLASIGNVIGAMNGLYNLRKLSEGSSMVSPEYVIAKMDAAMQYLSIGLFLAFLQQ